MRTFIVIVLALVVLLGVLAVAPWGHDLVAVRSTRYAAGFSEQAFRSVRVGDSREHIKGLLGHPLSRYFIVVQSNGIPDTLFAIPPSGLPAGVSLQREVLDFSASTRPPQDFRLVEVVLDSSGRVEFTRDYVTD